MFMPVDRVPKRFLFARRVASRAAVIAGLLGVLPWSGTAPSASAQVPLPPPPAYEPPQLSPSLLDFLTGRPVANQMKLAITPELLKPEFVEAPPGSPKALAAKVKALELDVPNRVAAANYLGTLDCVLFPEAKQQLLQMALEDPFEEVRYAAVMNLQAMLARGLGNPDRAGGFRLQEVGGCQCKRCKKAAKEREKTVDKILSETAKYQHKAELEALKPETVPDLFCKTLPGLIKLPFAKAKERCVQAKSKVSDDPPPEAVRADFCQGCCDEATLNGLSSIANDQRETSPCLAEPSARVREAAGRAMLLCGCYKRSGFNYPCPDEQLPIPAPMPLPMGEGDAPSAGEGDDGGEGDGGGGGTLQLEIVPLNDAPPAADGDLDLNLDLNGGSDGGSLDEQDASPGRPNRAFRPVLPSADSSGTPVLPAPPPERLSEPLGALPPSAVPRGALFVAPLFTDDRLFAEDRGPGAVVPETLSTGLASPRITSSHIVSSRMVSSRMVSSDGSTREDRDAVRAAAFMASAAEPKPAATLLDDRPPVSSPAPPESPVPPDSAPPADAAPPV